MEIIGLLIWAFHNLQTPLQTPIQTLLPEAGETSNYNILLDQATTLLLEMKLVETLM